MRKNEFDTLLTHERLQIRVTLIISCTRYTHKYYINLSEGVDQYIRLRLVMIMLIK